MNPALLKTKTHTHAHMSYHFRLIFSAWNRRRMKIVSLSDSVCSWDARVKRMKLILSWPHQNRSRWFCNVLYISLAIPSCNMIHLHFSRTEASSSQAQKVSITYKYIYTHMYFIFIFRRLQLCAVNSDRRQVSLFQGFPALTKN